jgi:hypothetical protein
MANRRYNTQVKLLMILVKKIYLEEKVHLLNGLVRSGKPKIAKKGWR